MGKLEALSATIENVVQLSLIFLLQNDHFWREIQIRDETSRGGNGPSMQRLQVNSFFTHAICCIANWNVSRLKKEYWWNGELVASDEWSLWTEVWCVVDSWSFVCYVLTIVLTLLGELAGSKREIFPGYSHLEAEMTRTCWLKCFTAEKARGELKCLT